MKKRTYLAILFLALFLLGLPSSGKAQPANEDESLMKSLEKYLKEASIVDINDHIAIGRTAPWIITLDDGKAKRRAIFKYVDSPRPSVVPSSYKYEIAAYELAKLLGIEIVPPVIAREIKGRKGSLQIFLENCISLKDKERKKLAPPDPQALANAVEEVKVFENLTYDECLNKSDIKIHQETWKVCRVDFGDAFSPIAEFLQGCEIERCSRRLYQGLLQVSDEALRSTLKPCLNDEEINALLARRKLIIEKIDQLVKEKGADAVLFS
jgi:hypothetical protein